MGIIQESQQYNKEIIEYLVDALHGYKEINRNIEFENFLILQSKIECRLISLIEKGKYKEIFTAEIIEQITNNIRGNFIENIINAKDYSLDSLLQLRVRNNIYETYTFNNKLQAIKDRKCLLLPLYALANDIPYEKATYILAEYFKIEYANCTDVEPVTETIDSKMKASKLYCLYNFYNKGNEAIFYASKLSISNETVLLPSSQYFYTIPKVLTLYNLNLIHYNPDAIIFLTDSLPLAFEQQKKYTDLYILKKLQKQKKYWEQEKEEFNKASRIKQNQNKITSWKQPFNDSIESIEKIEKEIGSILTKVNALNQFESQTHIFRRTDIVWSSWYKGASTVSRVNWLPLQGRKVNYIHFGELDKNTFLRKMLAVYAGIYTKVTSLELQFIYLPSAANTIEKNKNGAEFYSPDELLITAHNAGIAIPEILQDKLEELLRKLRKNKKERFLFDPIIGNKSFNLLLGKRGAGKSWLGISIAYSLATGRSFIKNWNVPKPCKVLYINGEVDDDLMDDRINLLDKFYSKSIKKKNVLFRTDRGLDLTTPESQVKVEKYLNTASLKEGDSRMPVSVLILDNLYFLALNAEKEKKWDILKNWILKLISDRKLSVLLLHHSNEDNRSFGTSNIEKVADDVLLLKKVKKKENEKKYLKIKVEETKNKRKLEFEPFNIFLDTDKKARWIEENSSNNFYSWKMEESEKLKIVISLRKNKKTWPEIADMFGVSLSTVEKFAQDNSLTISKKT